MLVTQKGANCCSTFMKTSTRLTNCWDIKLQLMWVVFIRTSERGVNPTASPHHRAWWSASWSKAGDVVCVSERHSTENKQFLLSACFQRCYSCGSNSQPLGHLPSSLASPSGSHLAKSYVNSSSGMNLRPPFPGKTGCQINNPDENLVLLLVWREWTSGIWDLGSCDIHKTLLRFDFISQAKM